MNILQFTYFQGKILVFRKRQIKPNNLHILQDGMSLHIVVFHISCKSSRVRSKNIKIFNRTFKKSFYLLVTSISTIELI